MTAFPDMKVHMNDLVVEPDAVTYCWTLTGTNTGSGGTGQRVRISGFEEWQIGADGLIAGSQGHFNSAEYQRQFGHGYRKPGSVTARAKFAGFIFLVRISWL